MIESLDKFWSSNFLGIEPEAHNLKVLCKDRWVRFHSLPESKRYPDDENEYLEVLLRHNTILKELCKTNEDIFVVLSEYSESEYAEELSPELVQLYPNSKYWSSVNQSEPDEQDNSFLHLYAAESKVSNAQINNLFRLTANDETSNVMLISVQNNIVYHPYDGGADILLRSEKERDVLKERYKEWLSCHPEGY